MSQESIERINSCSSSQLGDELLISMGEKTKAFQSPITFVPGIAINGVSTYNLFKYLFSLSSFIAKKKLL